MLLIMKLLSPIQLDAQLQGLSGFRSQGAADTQQSITVYGVIQPSGKEESA